MGGGHPPRASSLRSEQSELEAEIARLSAALDAARGELEALTSDRSGFGPATERSHGRVQGEPPVGHTSSVSRSPLSLDDERFRYVLEATSDGVVIVDADARITFANGRYATMVGYTREELIGHSGFDLLQDADHERGQAKLDRRRAGISEIHEMRLRHRDGHDVWVVARSLPVMDEEGRFEGSLGLVSEITDKRALEELRSRLTSIVDFSEDAIITCDVFGNITSWNRAAEHIYGYAEREMIGRPISLLIPDDRRTEEAGILARISSNKVVEHHETRRRREDGTLIDVSLTVSPIRDHEGRIIGASKIVRDLSERHRAAERLGEAEAQLRQAQKMDAIGKLAGGIAHDFNNLLSVILTCGSFLLDDFPRTGPYREDLEEITSAAMRASELTQQLLTLSRRRVLTRQIVDLNAILRSMERLLTRTLGETIELSLQLEPALGRVFADRGQLEQVIMNLVVNARDATSSGGAVIVETTNEHVDAGVATMHAEIAPGDYVVLSVSDTGRGMDDATKARIFEPFFTTKEVGKGTGLGLATVFGIVTQSGGYIDVQSTPKLGTTFRIYVPRTDKVNVPTAAPSPVVRSLRGTETLLVVEDEDAVRKAMRTSLTRQGYTVLDAPNGGEALLICEQHEGPIDLLITDVVLPRMTGTQLVERVASLRPGMRSLYVSGHTGDVLATASAETLSPFLQKPFTPESLARKVREVLTAPTSPRAAEG